VLELGEALAAEDREPRPGVVLPNDQVGGEIQRDPPLAQRGGVGTHGDEEVAQLRAFAGVERPVRRCRGGSLRTIVAWSVSHRR
jgi:hypothetical protein